VRQFTQDGRATFSVWPDQIERQISEASFYRPCLRRVRLSDLKMELFDEAEEFYRFRNLGKGEGALKN